jgi:multiple sugar transport system ATP-binding protein
MGQLKIEDLRKVFDTPSGEEVAVDGVSFSVEDNNFVTLVGPSGCGKTTTLRCIAGLETPTSGNIVLNDRNITELPANKRDLSMMFQSIALYPHMTVRENIAYPLKVAGVPKEERDKPTENAAETTQIADMMDKMPGDLSGGQRQRAALARTIVQEPAAFLMDEPLSDLDAKLKVETREEIQQIHRKFEKPMVYVTHDQEEAMTMSDKIAVMNDGQIEQFASPYETFHRPNNRFVGQFIGQHGMNTIDAELIDSGGRTVISVDEYVPDLKVGSEIEVETTGSIELGFRPENTAVKMNSDEGIPGTIQLLEAFGEVTVASIELDRGDSIHAVVDSRRDLSEGMDIRVDPQQNAHIFDYETGETLDHPTEEKKQAV